MSRSKILRHDQLRARLEQLRSQGRTIVFTNGCFDLLHPGHIRYLEAAKAEGDILVVGTNDDASVRALKGPGRPVQCAAARAEILAALSAVDYVTIFAGKTPAALISTVMPDVLVKGADWDADRIVGREVVEARGGRVVRAEYAEGFSTSALIRRIREGLCA